MFNINNINHKGNGNKDIIQDQIPREREVYLIMGITLVLMFLLSELTMKFLGKIGYGLVELLIIVPALIFLIKKRMRIKEIFRIRAVSLPLIGLSFIIGISMAVVSDELDRLVSLIYAMPEELSQALVKELKVSNLYELIVLWMGVAPIASITEEGLFRGFLQQSLELRKGVTKGVTTASLIFALIHLNPWWIIQILILSMLLGILAWRTESIVPGVIVHFINNSLGFWSVNADIEDLPVYTYKGLVSPLFFIPAVFILIWSMKKLFAITEYLHPETEETEAQDQETKEED